MAVTTAAVVGLAGTAAGAYSSYKGAKAQESAARAAQDAAGRSVQIGSFQGQGGGYGYNVNPAMGQTSLDYGAQGNLLNQMFGGLAQQQLGGFNQAQYGINQALVNQGYNLGQFGNPVDAQQAGLTGQLGTSFQNANDAYAGLAQSGQASMQNLQNTAFGGAAQQAALASQGFNDVRDSTLATLREQAQPFEQRQQNALNQNLFSTGRLGTSGGALQTEAFARGLGQADLSRQLEATNQARLTQQQALTQAQGLSGIGSNILNDAFGRFNQTAGIYDNSLQQRFANSALINNQNFNQNQQYFQNQVGLQQGGINNALAALQGQQAQQGLAMNLANFGLNLQQVQGNLNLGQQSNVVNAANNPNIGAGRDALGQIFAGAGSRLLGDQNLSTFLQGFGGGDNMNQLQYQNVTAQRM
jgi:hypothetical protein